MVLIMEVKNAIIIDGVLHKLVSIRGNDPCSHCSLHKECDLNFDEEPSLCTIIAGQFNLEECFVSCGKVTDIKIDKEE